MKTIIVNGTVISMDVTAFIKWENRAKAAGKSVEALLSEAVNNT